MKPYGIVRDKAYPVASLIWGHRLRSGQEWIEYLLEFLNVVSGFDFALGRGTSENDRYRRHTRLGLRRFVFYHEWEKTRHKHDDLARSRLLQNLKRQLVSSDPQVTEQEAVERLRALFLGLSALERERSWYAKSLLPIHENLLMWEALRKGATRRDAVSVDETVGNAELDQGIDFSQRNFFARGGELYYLILSAGTETNPARREAIEQGLQRLLRNNHPIGPLAARIETAWDSEVGSGSEGTMHYIPDTVRGLYEQIAEDVEALLEATLDPVEKLHLLAHLICFHVIIYIYTVASPDTISDRNGALAPRASLLVDALDGADRGVLRRVSATLFKVHEDSIQRRASHFVQDRIASWASEASSIASIIEILDSRLFAASDTSFSMGSKSSREAAYQRYKIAGGLFEQGEISRQDLLERTTAIVLDETIGDFRRHFLPIHRKLAKDIGLVTPRSGKNARYTLSDNLLKALTLANVRQAEGARTYEAYLDLLYDRYGLIIGEKHARASGLYQQQPINAEYYNRNQQALLTKMRRAGLAHEYSDATAIVSPFRS
jgi:hypothetical protein